VRAPIEMETNAPSHKVSKTKRAGVAKPTKFYRRGEAGTAGTDPAATEETNAGQYHVAAEDAWRISIWSYATN